MTATHSLAPVSAFKALIGTWADVYPMLNTVRLTLEDLLGRPGVALEMESITPFIRNRVEMAKGAGGSIGSKFVRRVTLLTTKCTPLLNLFVPRRFNREFA